MAEHYNKAGNAIHFPVGMKFVDEPGDEEPPTTSFGEILKYSLPYNSVGICNIPDWKQRLWYLNPETNHWCITEQVVQELQCNVYRFPEGLANDDTEFFGKLQALCLEHGINWSTSKERALFVRQQDFKEYMTELNEVYQDQPTRAKD